MDRPRKSCKVRRNAGICSLTQNRAEVVSLPFSANSNFFVDHTQMVLISFQKALAGILRCLLFAFFSTSPFPFSSESKEDVEKVDNFFLFFLFFCAERFWFSISWTLLLKGVVQWKCNGYGNLFIMFGMSIRTFVLVGPYETRSWQEQASSLLL